jgi:hypothetical protein
MVVAAPGSYIPQLNFPTLRPHTRDAFRWRAAFWKVGGMDNQPENLGLFLFLLFDLLLFLSLYYLRVDRKK